MRLRFGRLMLMTGRQLRRLIGAAIDPPDSLAGAMSIGPDGRSDAALLAVSTSQLSPIVPPNSRPSPILTLRANATWFETSRVRLSAFRPARS